MIDEQSSEQRLRRLSWRCRRGMKELDVLLQPFFEHRYISLSAEQQACFEAMMAEEDVDLLDWLVNAVPAPDNYAPLIGLILELPLA
ncbi:MAG: succinate dehydrogenase assembly factor 2 [Pseudomonadales bacterium]|nr:succinate dehydrogenase assembly factor 2 [Pseudomonadales bacterium]